MKLVVVDTETTSLEKPFCYNIGYLIADTENGEILCKKDFVVEQVWHNLPLFSTAYYAEKRPLYVERMRAKAVKMDKYGYICAEMRRDFKRYGVEKAFAYNSPFDEKVFAYNCEWFKVINPFDEIPFGDIRAFVHHCLVNKDFKDFCDRYGYYTESGNYSTTAETLFRYISGNTEFSEEHTALADSEIEWEILKKCCTEEIDFREDFTAYRSISKRTKKTLSVYSDNDLKAEFEYTDIRINRDKTKINLKNQWV